MGHLIREGICSVDDVLVPYRAAKAGRRPRFNARGVSLKTASLRYRTFDDSGTFCHCCGRQMLFFAFERQEDQVRLHANGYGFTIDGEEVLFTSDHIKPRSLGGSNSPLNLQTLCEPCNVRKGDQYDATDTPGVR